MTAWILQIWDYFMRRKGLLLLFLAFFILGGILSYRILTQGVAEAAPEYIHVDNIGVAPAEVEVPRTGGGVVQILGIMAPGEVVAMEVDSDNTKDENVGTDIIDVDAPLSEPVWPEGEENGTQQVIDLAADVAPVIENKAQPEKDEKPEMSAGYMAWLVISGIIVAGLGVYLLEQHFMR